MPADGSGVPGGMSALEPAHEDQQAGRLKIIAHKVHSQFFQPVCLATPRPHSGGLPSRSFK